MRFYFLFFLKCILILSVLIAVYNLTLFINSTYPSSMIYNNCLESSKVLLSEGNMLKLPFGMQVDNSTDGLMINNAYSIDSNAPLESYLKVRKNYNREKTKIQLTDTKQNLLSYSENNFKNNVPTPDTKYKIVEELNEHLNGNLNISVDYARYYHGYLLIYRPLLLLFNILEIRVLQFCVFIILFVILAVEINKKLGLKYMFAICFSLTIFQYFFISYSLQQAPIYILAMISTIIITKKIDSITFNNIYAYFLIVGSLTCFLDFLTTPLITLILPLLIYILYQSKNNTFNNKKLWFSVTIACGFWTCAYALTWISKWIICDVLLDTTIVKDAIQQVFYRSVGEARNDISNLLYFFRMISLSFIVFILFILIYDYIKQKRKTNYHFSIDNKPIIAYICTIPIIWCIITFNHFYNHIIFTFRNFMFIYCFIILLYFENSSFKKKVRSK